MKISQILTLTLIKQICKCVNILLQDKIYFRLMLVEWRDGA